MQLVWKALVSVGVALTIGACSLKNEAKQEDRTTSYTYRYDENGCDTGSHTFEIKLDYCQALLDDELNGGCARATREKNFRAGCSEYLGEDGSLPTDDEPDETP